jgi:signal transduction histidine kinase
VIVERLFSIFQPQWVGLYFRDEQTGALQLKTSKGERGDPSIHESHAASVSLIAERKVKGVLSVAWSREAARPTLEDEHLLERLSPQVSSAIDNAWLYAELRSLNAALESKVKSRTNELESRNAELERALQDLKATQAQLVQSEKLAGLGQLTAGLAHEINNPLAYAIANTAIARERLPAIERLLLVHEAAFEAARASSSEAALAAARRAIDVVGGSARFREDVQAFEADVHGLPADRAARLAMEFLRYLKTADATLTTPELPALGLSALLEKALGGLERVKNIVLDLRTFARMDEASFQDADLDEVVGCSLGIVEHLARSKGIALEVSYASAGRYSCFPAKLSQVVMNLVTNALQATKAGGQVRVSTFETEAGPVIEVVDSGCGIASNDLTRIFDPFYTTKAVGEGTGLGLSISYQIVREHDGRIVVQSEPNRGSTFRVELPPRANIESRT